MDGYVSLDVVNFLIELKTICNTFMFMCVMEGVRDLGSDQTSYLQRRENYFKIPIFTIKFPSRRAL